MKLENYPALKFAVVFICGILFSNALIKNSSVNFSSDFLSNSFTGSFYIWIIIVLMIAAFVYLLRKKKQSSLSYILLILIAFLIGALRADIESRSQSETQIFRIPDMYPKSSISLIGVVKDIPEYDSNRVKFPFICEKFISGNDTTELSGNILVTSYNPSGDKDIKLPLIKAGDRLSIPGYLHDGNGERNPGEFSYKRFLRFVNIDKLFTNNDCSTIEFISDGNLNFFYSKLIYPLKYYVFEQINKSIPGNEGAFLNGLITGIRSDITEDVKQDFINSGTTHIIAVSGLNVVYVVLIITLTLMLFRIPLVPRVIITIFLLIYYCFFTGAAPSIVRATVMGSLVLISYILQRKPAFLNIMGVAALIILLIDPKQLFDNGFILSFVSLTAIILVHDKFEKTFLEKLRNKYEGIIAALLIRGLELALVTFAAVIGTLPFVLGMFGKLSLASFFTNIIAVPLSNISLAIGIFQIIVSFFSTGIAQLIAGVNFYLLKFLLSFISYSASFKYSAIRFSEIDIFSSVLYYVIFTCLLLITLKNLKYILPVIVLSAAAFIYHNSDHSNELKVTFLDIGQGDCAIIRTNGNKTILVDCGMNSIFIDSGERTILPYLQRNGIKKIDLMIITHLHMDHIGGMKYLLENIPVEKIYDSGQRFESYYTNSIDSIINSKHIARQSIKEGFTDTTFQDIKLAFVFPNSGFVNSEGMTVANNLNNGSLVFKLQYKNSSILFAGDVEQYAEEDIINKHGDMLKSDILKSPHHGSFTSSTIPFLNKVQPEYAVISCGKFNMFDHPSDIIIERYDQMKIKTIRTDNDNAAVFEYKDGGLKEVQWK